MSPKIQAILDTALAQVRAALLEEASQAVTQALGGGGEIPTPFRNGRGKPGPKPKAPRAAAARPKGAKRTPEELEALTQSFVSQVKKTPGENIETIARSLNVGTKDLALPVQKALARPAQVSTKGQKRGTKYFPK